VTPYPDIPDFFAIAARSDKDLAGAFHFYTLLDVNGLFGLCYAVTHHPCRRASRRRTGCGVFPVRIGASCPKPYFRIMRVPGHEIEETLGVLPVEVFVHFAKIETEGMQRA
jgi:hypothetical protein